MLVVFVAFCWETCGLMFLGFLAKEERGSCQPLPLSCFSSLPAMVKILCHSVLNHSQDDKKNKKDKKDKKDAKASIESRQPNAKCNAKCNKYTK